jgi:hypothetical protein
MADFKYSEPSIQNLFSVISNSTTKVKKLNIAVVLLHYGFLLVGFNTFLVAAMLLFCFTLFVLISPYEDLRYHFWIFFVVGPGLLVFGFISILQAISYIKNRLRKKKK